LYEERPKEFSQPKTTNESIEYLATQILYATLGHINNVLLSRIKVDSRVNILQSKTEFLRESSGLF
jgi:hypothetical protein